MSVVANRAQVAAQHPPVLRAKRLGIETYQEAVIYMRQDCSVCRSEGFTAQARVEVRAGGRSTIATLAIVTNDLLAHGEAGLSEAAWRRLGLSEGDDIEVAHPTPVDSLSQVRAKIYGHRLGPDALTRIIDDVVAGRFADVHLAAFIAACAGRALDRREMLALTQAMVLAGQRLDWGARSIADKHSVGGLPGNRTTPIVVAIAASCGLTIPKTSSRAITSPAGTADTMETLTVVDLDVPSIRRVVEQEGGCLVWGGAVNLSPADDILIRVERMLDLDSEGQLVASVLSKKIAAGATHVLLDLPVGPTAKVRSPADAARLSHALKAVAKAAGLEARVVETDGTQPIGRGIGPALEARDVLGVLQNDSVAPQSLRQRAVLLAGALLELLERAPRGEGEVLAAAALDEGRAWRKFKAICRAQGALREPPRARFMHPVVAPARGRVSSIDNRLLARIAKLAGAPSAKAAGVDLHTPLGASVERGQPLYTVHAESRGELAYAVDYARLHAEAVRIEAS